MKKIILITGGQRSGKSVYAEKLALSLSDNPVYLATAHVWDDEFKERVRKHQERRGEQWTNIEEEKYLSRHDIYNKVIVIDCVTLWCTNFFFDREADADTQPTVSGNAVQRRFTDMQGWMNQYVASKADEVIMMVCGIPVKIK